MTTNDVQDIRGHRFTERDDIFLDANVWLYIYGPVPPRDWRAEVYSAAFRKMRETRSKIHVEVLVLSEFINKYARVLYDQLPESKKPRAFKEWRKHPDFKNVAEEIASQARRIVGKAVRCESGFEAADMDALLTDYSRGDSDFNDQMIAEFCKRRNLTLVTHDSDFGRYGLSILTANANLLGT